MAQIKYITGPLKSGKTETVIGEIIAVLKTGQSVAGVLPSVEHINYLKMEILRRQPALAPGQLSLGTFFEWARRILDSARRNFQTIENAEEWLELHDLLRKTRSDDHFYSGYIQILQSIFNDFRESGLTSAELDKLALSSGEPQMRAWVSHFNRMRRNYRQNGAGPSGELLVLALELLQNQPPTDWGELLVIDGFYEFTPIQYKILQSLTASFPGIICTSLTNSSQTVYDYCRNRPGLLGAGVTLVLSAKPTGVEWSEVIRTNLFRDILNGNQSESNTQSKWKNEWHFPLKVVQCPTRRAEVETAARTIKGWLTEGMNPDKIGIVFRGSYDYSGLIDLLFPGFGLPVNSAHPPLTLTEPGQLLNRIVQVNLENFNRSAFLDLLRLPAVRRYYGADPLQDFEIHSAEWGLPTSKSDWITRCRQHLDYLQFILNTDSDENERERRNARSQIKRLQTIQPMLTKLLEDFSLPENTAWADFQHLFIKILARYYPDDQRPEAQIIQQIKSLLNRLLRLRSARIKTSLEELAEILPRFFATETNGAKIKTPGIHYAKLMDARAWEMDGLILLGLVDGEFPAIHPENALFRNDLRARLNQKAGQVHFAETGFNLAEEKFLFYLITSRANQRLLITYPESNSGGRVLPVSPFVAELLACQPANDSQKILSWEAISASQVLPEITTCASTGDLFEIILAEKAAGIDIEKLASLTDENIFKSITTRLDCERGRLAGDGIRNGILPCDHFYPQFISSPISATKIQDYVNCPFAYLCAHIWNIEIPGEPQIGLDAMTEGLLIHKALEQLIRDFLADKSCNWSDFLNEIDDDYLARLIGRLDSLFRPKLYFVPGLLWEQILSELRIGLRHFVATERRFLETGFIPLQTEQQFSLRDETLQIGDNPKIPLILTGKIDRIDYKADGERFIVIDYKRSGGSIIEIVNGVKNGRQFQIPIYLLMVLQKQPAKKVGGAFYYSFKDGNRTRGFLVDTKIERSKTLNHNELDNLLAETRRQVGAILEQIYRGNFSIAQRSEKGCQSNKCDFYDLCRMEAN